MPQASHLARVALVMDCRAEPTGLPQTLIATSDGPKDLLIHSIASSRKVSWPHVPWSLLLSEKRVSCPLVFSHVQGREYLIREGSCQKASLRKKKPGNAEKSPFCWATWIPSFLLAGVL